MPSIDQVVDFLKKHGALDLGRPAADLIDTADEIPSEWPWPEVEEGQEIAEIDWERLFPKPPRQRRDSVDLDGKDQEVVFDSEEITTPWEIEPTDEEIRELKEAIGKGPPDTYFDSNGQTVWDTCAWYQPIHFYGHDWGIYIKEDCVKRIALRMARFISPYATPRPWHEWWKALYRAATASLFLHEHFHHQVESLAFRLHAVHGSPRYVSYFNRVYMVAKGTDNHLEEALANAESYLRIARQPYKRWLGPDVLDAVQSYLRWQFPRDPAGYRMARNYLTVRTFDQGENILQCQVNSCSLTPGQSPDDWEMAPHMTTPFFNVKAPVWTVINAGAKTRMPVKGVLHYPTCSTQEMIRLLASRGYQLIAGGKGSHVKLKKPGAPTMILPGNRRELSPGVAKTALQILGEYTLHDLRHLLASC